MKIIARMPGIFRKDVGDEIFNDLVRIFPEGDRSSHHHVFECFLPVGDPRVTRLMERLATAGFHPRVRHFEKPRHEKEYRLDLDREYDDADLKECEYLQLLPPQEAFNYDSPARADDGTLIIVEEYLPEGDFDVRGDNPYSYFVPTRVKGLLEADELAGLRFKPTYFRPRLGTNAASNESQERHDMPFWEIDSDRSMPPLSRTMTLLDIEGRRLPPGSAGPCFVSEGLYLHPELHYRSNDLQNIAPFDVARTFEDPAGSVEHPLIVSGRFYDIFSGHGLRTGWIPIRIDSD